MTKKERVQITLKHEKADMLPVDFVFEDWRTMNRFATHYGLTYDELLEFMGVDIIYLNVMDEVQKFVYDPDLMNFVFSHGIARQDKDDPHIVYDRWGIGWRTDHDGERPVENVVIEDIEKIDEFEAPDPIIDGQFYELEKSLKHYNDLGYACAVGQYYGMFEKMWLLQGFEAGLMSHYTNPDEVEELLDKIMNYRIKLSKKLVTYDIAFGHSGDDYGTQRGPMISLEMWREFYKPRLEKIWKVYKDAGLSVVHHSCGDCSIFLDDMLEIGLDAIHPVQSSAMDIEALGKRYGMELVFYGAIDCQQTLKLGSPEDVDANVKYVVEALGKKGNMVLAPINIMQDTTVENFDALVKAVKKYRYI